MRQHLERLHAGTAGFLEQRRCAREIERLALLTGRIGTRRDPTWLALDAGLLPPVLQPGAALGIVEMRNHLLKGTNNAH